jgi:hypothetical protein
MTAADRPVVAPLLFGKRKPVAPVAAAQYTGTDTELDLKGVA